MRDPIPGYLQVTVFLAGFASMATEMAAPRLLAPSFGMTQLVWAHVIGSVLVALALGGYVGGRLADRFPTERAYGLSLALGGVLIAAIPSVSVRLAPEAFPLALDGMLDAGARLWATCLLFTPGVGVLGMVSPWAVRLSSRDPLRLGSTVGRLAALATVGSVAGTFTAALGALPWLGTRATLLILGAALVAAGAVRAPRLAGFVCVLVVAALTWFGRPPETARALELSATETPYQHVRVRAVGGDRYLLFNEGAGVQSVWRPNLDYSGGYWDTLALLGEVVSRAGEPLRVLLLGVAGGTTAAVLERRFSATHQLSVTGVELDPGVTAVAREHLGLGELSHLTIHHEDARPFVSRSRATYDLILVDVMEGFSPPFHLTTREFFDACKRRLAPRGVLAMNLPGPGLDTRLSRGLGSTLRSVFPHVSVFDASPEATLIRNAVFVASLEPKEPPQKGVRDPAAPTLNRIRATWHAFDAPAGAHQLVDDRAPVGWLSALSILDATTRE